MGEHNYHERKDLKYNVDSSAGLGIRSLVFRANSLFYCMSESAIHSFTREQQEQFALGHKKGEKHQNIQKIRFLMILFE